MTLDFLTLWTATGHTAPAVEYRFCERHWRFDYCWPEQKVALELDGDNLPAWVVVMVNAATALGWRVLRFSNQQWERDPHGCMALIERMLEIGQ